MIFRDWTVKVTDFGCAMVLKDKNWPKGYTESYCSPEFLKLMKLNSDFDKQTLIENDRFAVDKILKQLKMGKEIAYEPADDSIFEEDMKLMENLYEEARRENDYHYMDAYNKKLFFTASSNTLELIRVGTLK